MERDVKKIHLPPVSLPYARVLVVDDVLTSLYIVKGMMKPYNMEVDCVSSGQEAVDAVREERVRYDAIFMDHRMYEMDGIETVRIIRKEIGTDYAKTIPIIALTANEHINEELFLNSGFQAFLPKPVEICRLDAVLRQWVQNEEKEKAYNAAKGSEEFSGSEKDRRSGRERRNGHDRRLFQEKIEGINVRKGMERFSGDRDTFREILQSFAVYTMPILERMREVNKNNLAGYAINAHGIKSSCRGICADVLGDRAETLEKAAENGDIAFVIDNNKVFIDDVLELITNIETALTCGVNTVMQIVKLKKDKPYSEALIKLKTACDSSCIEKIDEIMNEIEYFEYTSDDKLVQWLRENINEMNYAAISEKIAELNNGGAHE